MQAASLTVQLVPGIRENALDSEVAKSKALKQNRSTIGTTATPKTVLLTDNTHGLLRDETLNNTNRREHDHTSTRLERENANVCSTALTCWGCSNVMSTVTPKTALYTDNTRRVLRD
eukprot:609838-Rhodomonas_salina.2